MQQASLKALSHAVLARNKAATLVQLCVENKCNFAPLKTGSKLQSQNGVTGYELTGTLARRNCVVEMLSERPETRYAFVVDDPETDPVIVAAGIRGIGTCELAIPKARYDGLALMEAIAGFRDALVVDNLASRAWRLCHSKR